MNILVLLIYICVSTCLLNDSCCTLQLTVVTSSIMDQNLIPDIVVYIFVKSFCIILVKHPTGMVTHLYQSRFHISSRDGVSNIERYVKNIISLQHVELHRKLAFPFDFFKVYIIVIIRDVLISPERNFLPRWHFHFSLSSLTARAGCRFFLPHLLN